MNRDTYNPSRTKKTESSYEKRAMWITAKYKNQTGLDWDVDLPRFSTWLTEYRDTLSVAAWRQYRAALVWYVKDRYSMFSKEAFNIASSIKEIPTEGCQKARYTSANKKKSLNETELEAITAELIRRHNRTRSNSSELSTPMATLLYLMASEITGLRPSEWWNTEIKREEEINGVDTITLKVKNGKATNGRAHGEYRNLHFKSLPEESLTVLLRHYRSIKSLPDYSAFETYLSRCTSCMTSTTHKLWPRKIKRPSLYSGRHQFSANLKKAKMPLSMLAALMGHGTDETATTHYGKGQFGRGNENGVEADPDDVSRVRQIHESWHPEKSKFPSGPR